MTSTPNDDPRSPDDTAGPPTAGGPTPGSAGVLPDPTLTLLARITVDIDPPVELGATGRGRRRLIPLAGGRADGPVVSGSIVPGGVDVQVIRPDGVSEIEARYGIALDDGGHVFVENIGIRHAPDEVSARLAAGEPVDPAEVYFRTVARLETDRDDLRWLERTLVIGVGGRFPDSVRIDLHALG
ncbi:MAG: DUF3237 domain-containing protein [Acidimicrobiales bacterium]